MGGMFVGMGKKKKKKGKRKKEKEVRPDNNYMKKKSYAQKDPSSYLYQRYTYLFPIPPRVYIIINS